jgi:hypothetical protein
VAVAVALHDELRRTPPARLAPALLLFGAGEGAPLAARAHLRQEHPERERIVVLELGPCGEGEPAFATAHPQLRTAAQRAVEALGTGRATPPRRSTAARARRLPGAWIGALDADNLAPRARQTTDTPDRLDPAALERTLDFALAIVDALDTELEGSDPVEGG